VAGAATERDPLTTAPASGLDKLAPPPLPPTAVTCTLATPAGTPNDCSAPVLENVHVTTCPDCEQFAGNASA
jgi:hypothetical protein